MRYIPAYFVALVIFCLLDFLWLGFVVKGFYQARIGDMILPQPRWGAAAIFYLLFVVGLVYFAVAGGVQTGMWPSAAVNGALFGFFAYLTYDFSNLAVMKGYDAAVAVADTLWGAVLSGVTAALTVVIVSYFTRSSG